jgi:hypothetical protein
MGAWHFVGTRLRPLLPETHSLGYVGRDEASSPATGIFKVHQREEAELVNRALARIQQPASARAEPPRRQTRTAAEGRS